MPVRITTQTVSTVAITRQNGGICLKENFFILPLFK
jgi:hypothetical protein